jgi:nucleotide-binding universal stress UspA family protein
LLEPFVDCPAPSAPAATPYKRILVGVDTDPLSREVACYAGQLAVTGAILQLLTVVADPRGLLPAAGTTLDWAVVHDDLRRSAASTIEAFRASLAAQGIDVETKTVDLAFDGGRLADALDKEVTAWNADVLVIGSHHRHGFERLMLGSTAMSVVRGARCPVLLVPEHASERTVPPKRVLIAIDGSMTSYRGLAEAIRFAGSDALLHVVYVVDRVMCRSEMMPIEPLYGTLIKEGELAIADASRLLLAHRGDSDAEIIETHSVNDDVPHALIREAHAWGADMIVMGTHGRRGPGRWLLGSVAERVARLAPLTVMLVPQPGSAR